MWGIKVSKVAEIGNQVPHLAQDTNGKVANLQLDTTNESQEVSPFLSQMKQIFSLIIKLIFDLKYTYKQVYWSRDY